MADDSDKTEEPTDHKLKKAREEGNIPKSEDLNGFFGLLFALLGMAALLYFTPGPMVSFLSVCTEEIFSVKPGFLPGSCLEFSKYLGMWTAAIFAGMILAAFIGYFIMNKTIVIAKEPIKFNIEALNIGTNFKNLFSKQNVVQTVMSVGKEFLFYGVLYFFLSKYFHGFVYETFCYENCSGFTAFYYIAFLVATYMAISLIFTIIDYPLKIMFWKEKLKMSHKDLKDEHKEMEGSPEVKREQQQFRWEMMNGSPAGPKNATFFVRGSSGIYGIRYNRNESPAPIVVAIGKGDRAIALSQIAQSLRRLVVDDEDFVKNLNAKAKMGRPVPLEFVAQIRQAIMQLRSHEAKYGAVHK